MAQSLRTSPVQSGRESNRTSSPVRQPDSSRRARWGLTAGAVVAITFVSAIPALGAAGATSPPPSGSFLGGLHTQTSLGSTIPANGDVNPYGVAVVPKTMGRLVAGDALVSNFNNSTNAQGTGTTIVQIAPNGTRSLFATVKAGSPCSGGIGLTTALNVLSNGWVVVGNLPTNAGTLEPGASGCLTVLGPSGQFTLALATGAVNGPWDMTAVSRGQFEYLFVTNVLNGTLAANGSTVNRGTVLRITLDLSGSGPKFVGQQIVGSGFPERTDPAALVVGPTGVAVNPAGTLYVADSAGNSIWAISNAINRSTGAGRGSLVTSGGHLNNPLGMALAPNGDILTANGADGNIVETTPTGMQVAKRLVDSNPSPGPDPGNGALFGLAVIPGGGGLYFVDDDLNTLNLLSP